MARQRFVPGLHPERFEVEKETRPGESVSGKLARLRLEGQGRRRDGQEADNFWERRFVDPPPQLVLLQKDRFRSGGFRAPPSWAAREASSSPTSDGPERRRTILFDDAASSGSLVDACLCRLAEDLATDDPLSAEHIPMLSTTQRERLMRLAAERSPLSEAGVDAVLSPPLSDDDLGMVEATLSFSQVSLPRLRRLLVSDDGLVHPSLTSLAISSCPHLPISTQLLSLFSNLPLRRLTVSHCALAPTLPAAGALNRLANATPSLQELDLSGNPSWAGKEQLEGLDWTVKWTRLRTLRLRGGDGSFLAERRRKGGGWIELVAS